MADKKRVLLVNPQPLRRGGAQAVIMSIVRNLSDEFCFDILLFSDEIGYYDEEFLSYGGKIIRIPNYGGSNRFRQRADLYIRWIDNKPKVRAAIRKNGPYDAIHTFAAYEAGFLLKAADQCGIPLRIAHTLTITDIPKSKTLMRCYAHFALQAIKKHGTALIGCTEEACATMFGSDAGWRLIFNPYRAQAFDAGKFAQNEKHTAPAMIQVASYNANKNQLFTIEVFKYVAEKYPNATLRFIGYELEDGYLAKMQNQIAEYGLTDNVTFDPHDADIPQLLSRSSYLLLPSVREGFGIVLVEAQSLGLRCLASATMPKLPDCGGCAFLPLAEPKAWAEHIIADFEQTGGVRTPFDCSKFTEESIMKNYRNLYRTGHI